VGGEPFEGKSGCDRAWRHVTQHIIGGKMRVRIGDTKSTYFTGGHKSLTFIPSRSTLLDLVLGGGWPLKRISNIVGDKSTGKTQIAIEAMISFLKMYPKGIVEYQEVESAFDVPYAEELGLDMSRVKILEDVETIEGTMKATKLFLKRIETKEQPGFKIVDTLDGIHNRETFGLPDGYEKAKRAGLVNDMMTQCAGMFKRSNAHMMVVSQIRDNIGVMFGERYRRAGGKALDFYASQCLWLAEIKKIVKTVGSIKRDVAIRVRAKCKKSKVGLPYRSCEFPVVFGYGIDDITSCIEWLNDTGFLDELDSKGLKLKELADHIKAGDREMYKRMVELTKEKWYKIETKFLPKYKKFD
jgi:recombination protein RecA